MNDGAGAPVAPFGGGVGSPGSLPPLLGSEVVDRLLRVNLELAAELWVLRGRLSMLERQLVERDLVTSPDDLPARSDEERAHDRSERVAAVQRIFGVLAD